MLWHGDAERRIDEWEEKGAISGDKLEELKERDRRLYAALYKPNESGKVIDFLSIRQNRNEPLNNQERSTLERERKDLVTDVKRIFRELKGRYTAKAAEGLKLQKKVDSVLGTNKAESFATELPWESFEEHMLNMTERAPSIGDLHLLRTCLDEIATNITKSMDQQEKEVDSLRNKLH
jgi:hypothetical protein